MRELEVQYSTGEKDKIPVDFTYEDLLKEIDKQKATILLQSATADNLFKKLDDKDEEIADLKRQLKSIKMMKEETNDYDSPMRGMKL